MTKQTLDAILDKKSKIKILRSIFSQAQDYMASGREIARLAGVTAPSAHTALKQLHSQGILRLRVIGRDHIYQLNTQAPIVTTILGPMFEKETELAGEAGR